jgi:hypothetical protein
VRGSPFQKAAPADVRDFPRVLGEYTREQKLFSLETAVHKMTGMPAQRLRLRDRGLLQPGYAAASTHYQEVVRGGHARDRTLALTKRFRSRKSAGLSGFVIPPRWYSRSGCSSSSPPSGRRCGRRQRWRVPAHSLTFSSVAPSLVPVNVT